MSDSSLTRNFSPSIAWGEYNKVAFAIEQALAHVQTALPVKIVACTNNGGVSPVGFVDAIPLVHQTDANGNTVPHATIYNLPYCRIQGGANAVIIDPQVGDIGVAVFASRDISKVKNAKKASPPGSMRKYSFSDGMYIAGAMNGTPTQYIRFSSAGIEIHSPTGITEQAPNVDVVASTEASITAPTASITASTASVTASAVNLGATGQTLHALIDERINAWLSTHTHNVTAVGSPTSTPIQSLPASTTSTVKAG